MKDEYKPHAFVLKEDGKIYYVNMPEANDFVDQDDVSTRFDQAGYDEALQSAIASGIEVENQEEIEGRLTVIHEHHNGFKLQPGKLYPLHCNAEVIEEWIPGQGYKSPSKEIARVTFEQPENLTNKYETGEGWLTRKPEASGQEQEAVDHANRILFSNLKCQIGNIFTKKFLEHNDGKFHTALELNPAIHAVTEFVFEKIKQQKP